MKKSKFITSSLLAVFVIALGGVFFTSSSTVEQSNSGVIAELSAELANMKEELTSLKFTERNEAVSAEPFLGEVILFAGNFAPRGWALCEGQLLSISSYEALFSIIGTTYGGDGIANFALPDLRGRSPIGAGHGPGLSTFRPGSRAGAESHTLNIREMPNHNHTTGEVPAFEMHPEEKDHSYTKGSNSFITVGNQANAQVSNLEVSTNPTGGSLPFSIRDPYLGMHYIIALQGIYPSRN